jgi:hypothetical protein
MASVLICNRFRRGIKMKQGYELKARVVFTVHKDGEEIELGACRVTETRSSSDSCDAVFHVASNVIGDAVRESLEAIKALVG